MIIYNNHNNSICDINETNDNQNNKDNNDDILMMTTKMVNSPNKFVKALINSLVFNVGETPTCLCHGYRLPGFTSRYKPFHGYDITMTS